MKLRLLSSAFALLAVAACSTTSTVVGNPNNPNPEDEGTLPAEEDDDPANQPPHSLGTIVLGEAHSSVGSGAGKSTPIVSAAFIPDAMLGRACKTKLDDACEIVKAPKCNKITTSTNGCSEGESCAYDTDCKAVCKKIAQCEESCEKDEVCTLPKSGTSTIGTCVKREAFDAGPIAFSGTTTAITLYPPYAYEGDGSGAPFLAGAEIKVQATGATEAGFEAFDETFKATKFLQTTPSLSKISREKIFGTGSIPIAWAAGEDTILITVSSIGGSATCKVKDSLGKFDLPRSVVKAVQGEVKVGEEAGTPSLAITVARQRKEIKKDKKAKGELLISEVKPEGWLELVTMSTESASFQGCSGSDVICGDSCADLKYDNENCGSCGNACSSTQSCNSGKCGGSAEACQSCVSSASAGACSAASNACQSDSACASLLSCLQGCSTTTCQSTCRTNNPAGVTKFNNLESCLQSACASQCEGG